jgi:hypothetical protein
MLLERPGYTYCGLVTRMYAGRMDLEHRIKKLKEDPSLDTFCC